MITNWMKCLALAGTALVGLSGCVTTPVQRQMNTAQAEVSEKGNEALDVLHNTGAEYLRQLDEIYVGGEPIPLERQKALPPIFDRTVRLQRPVVPVNLQSVAQFVTAMFSVGVTVTPDAVTAAEAIGSDPAADALGASAKPGSFLINYEGTLRGLLDLVSSRTGNAWHYDAKRRSVVITHLDTKTFYLASLPLTSGASASVSNESASAGGGQGGMGGMGGGAMGGGGQGGQGSQGGQNINAGQTTTSDTKVQVLADAAKAVETMLSKQGKMAVDSSAQAITVTDAPTVIGRVSRYVDTLNKHLRRQVAMEVKVFTLDLKRGDQYGVDWNLIYQSLNGKFGITTNSVGSLGPEANSMSLSVIDPSYNYNGSQLLLKALASRGKLIARKTVGVITLSGRPVPVQVASQTGYLASVGATLVPNAGAIQQTTPGTVTTGFAMNVLPVVLDDQNVMMQIALNMSTLRELRTIPSGTGTRIESPNVDTRQFMQQVILPSDGTLVMSGYDADGFTGKERGIGSPDFWLAGGSTSTSHDRTMLVILVTPKVM